MNRKNPKGSVAITIDQGRLRLRWTWEGKRYSLNHSFNSPVNLLAAKKWSSRCKPPAKQAIGMWMICYIGAEEGGVLC
ncbi:MAG TPA: hypothetical protein VG870_07820 [Chitinophagaceae bacterium]|nr:hypothetical protein [Chitinophagaceae bacterium]